jgi:thiol-disulfide isomerase/thioredoxin
MKPRFRSGWLALLAVVACWTGPPAVAATATEFAFEDINPKSASFGELLKLSDIYTDRGVVLNFLASWCGYCWKELPELQRLDETGVAPVLGVAADEYDGAGELKKMIGRLDLSFPVLLVPPGEIDAMGRGYRHRMLPATYLIDSNGRIRRVFQGAVSGTDLERAVASELVPDPLQ